MAHLKKKSIDSYISAMSQAVYFYFSNQSLDVFFINTFKRMRMLVRGTFQVGAQHRGSVHASHPAAPGLIPLVTKKISDKKINSLLKRFMNRPD